MGIKISPVLADKAKILGCDLHGIMEKSIRDVYPIVGKIPLEIAVVPGITETPFARYDPHLDRVEVDIFQNLLERSYGKGTSMERDIALRSIMDHELVDVIKFSPAGSHLKRLITGPISALTNLMGMKLPGSEKFEALFNTPSGVGIMVDDVCQDIKVDRVLLKKLWHFVMGFGLSQKHYVEIDWHNLRNLSVEKTPSGYSINMDPYKFLHTIIPAMRRAIINDNIWKAGGKIRLTGYNGRLSSFVKDRVIGQKIRYPELQHRLRLIYKGLSRRWHDNDSIKELAINFADKVSYATAA